MKTLAWLLVVATTACSAARFRGAQATSGAGSGAGGSVSAGQGGATAAQNASASQNASAMSSSTGFNPTTSATGSGGGAPQVAEVYGHSADTLYRLDPNTKAVTVVGPFAGCNQVIDFAIDADGHTFVTTFGGFYALDKKTAVCTHISSGTYPNSLSFVPKGTVFPDKEALVGYFGAIYVQIDTATGKVSTIGELGNGYQSSGDIVSVKGGGTYLTVNGSGCNDCLIEVDAKTGAMTKNWGPLGYSAVYGIAFWAGAVYGFDDGGDLFEVDFSNNALTTKPIAVPNPPPGLSFWGAGSTTSAPVGQPM